MFDEESFRESMFLISGAEEKVMIVFEIFDKFLSFFYFVVYISVAKFKPAKKKKNQINITRLKKGVQIEKSLQFIENWDEYPGS